MTTKEEAIELIETIIDPELGIDIWTMGLIYEINIIDEKNIHIVMTFTTPMCPAGPALQKEVTDNMRSLGFDRVDLEITFDPPWKPSLELRQALGLA